MLKTLPGTTLEFDWSRLEEVEKTLSSLFLAGGLTLSQVSGLTGLEPYMIQNWVRRGFLAPPERKRYTRRQFSRIVIINMLKDSMHCNTFTFDKIEGIFSKNSTAILIVISRISAMDFPRKRTSNVSRLYRLP